MMTKTTKKAKTKKTIGAASEPEPRVTRQSSGAKVGRKYKTLDDRVVHIEYRFDYGKPQQADASDLWWTGKEKVKNTSVFPWVQQDD